MSGNSRKVGFVSLGCPKALVDSERILTQLRMDGYDVVPTYEDAELVVVNTCGFIDSAKQESLDAIGEAIAENGKVIVTGCMGKGSDANAIRAQHPSVLSVTGPAAYEEVVGAVHEFVPPPTEHNPYTDLVPPQGVRLTPRHYAYLKISEGCNHRCSFCIIPHMRGDLVSRPIGDVMDEAERLVRAGVRELLVISQDTSAYGVDSKFRSGFWNGRPLKTNMQALCEALSEFGVWVRLHYVYPYPHVDEVLPLMAEGRVLPYLDIPLQHASGPMLKAMRRGVTRAGQERILDRVRQHVPDIAVRTTFIVGFPGETDADFDELCDFVKCQEFDHVGVFTYFQEDGTPAAELPGQVPDAVKNERQAELMALQAGISKKRLSARVGSIVDVLVEGASEESDLLLRGRTAWQAPDVDGQVYIVSPPPDVAIGQIRPLRITKAGEYDLVGELIK